MCFVFGCILGGFVLVVMFVWVVFVVGCSLLDCALWVVCCFDFALGIMLFWVLIIVWVGMFCFVWVVLCLLVCVFVVGGCLFLYVVARLLIFFCFVVNFYYKMWLVGGWGLLGIWWGLI